MGFLSSFKEKQELKRSIRAEAAADVKKAYGSAYKKKLVSDAKKKAKLDARTPYEKMKDAQKAFKKFQGRKVERKFEI